MDFYPLNNSCFITFINTAVYNGTIIRYTWCIPRKIIIIVLNAVNNIYINMLFFKFCIIYISIKIKNSVNGTKLLLKYSNHKYTVICTDSSLIVIFFTYMGVIILFFLFFHHP